ncbi:hypothetical protein PINS_up022219 [Pythium insidiosum]|nr:hypothetical protein PINS_up022219 [Pythium insidiosum]
MDVMMNMTTDDVRKLREKFTTNLSLEQFVTVMKTSLADRISSEVTNSIGCTMSVSDRPLVLLAA